VGSFSPRFLEELGIKKKEAIPSSGKGNIIPDITPGDD